MHRTADNRARLPVIAISAFATFAAVASVATTARAADVAIASAADLSKLSGAVAPGTVFVLADGTYSAPGNVSCAANGTEASPIVVRAANPGKAKITFSAGTVEGFKVTGAHWHFEGLDVRGTCADDSSCEHAFHVTGGATGFWLRQSKVADFNAQLKVNADKVNGVMTIPHKGLIEGNDLGDSRGRKTSNPVTKLNIDTGDDWIVRGNVIHDFFKDGGDTVSYGVFLKSGGNRGLIESNLVLCARDVPNGGARIGTSLGGGGTGNQFCAPAFDANVPCSIEHTDGVIRNNIIANCSDVAVYLNEAKNTKVLHNTMIGTAGVDFRFATTSGEARGNLYEGRIRGRDSGTFTDGGNKLVDTAFFAASYTSPLTGDLRLKAGPPAAAVDLAPAPGVPSDYCGRARSDGKPDFGALESSLGDCATLQGGIGGTTPPADPDGGAPIGDGGTGTGTDGGTSSADGGGTGGTSGTSGTGDDSGCAVGLGAGSASGSATLFALFATVAGLVVGRRRRGNVSTKAPRSL